MIIAWSLLHPSSLQFLMNFVFLLELWVIFEHMHRVKRLVGMN